MTGLLYIDLLANADQKRRMDPVPSEQYPVIDSVRSSFDLFLASLPDLVGRASQVLSDENINSITSTLASIEKSAAPLPATMENASAVVAELKTTISEVRTTVASARQLLDTSGPNLADASDRIRVISDNLAKTSANLDKLMADHREDLGLFFRDSLPEMERLLRDSRRPRRNSANCRAA